MPICKNIFLAWSEGLHIGEGICKPKWKDAYKQVSRRSSACRAFGDAFRFENARVGTVNQFLVSDAHNFFFYIHELLCIDRVICHDYLR